MKKQIVINASKDRSRIAIVEDGELVELYVENPDNVRSIGNVYLGRVQKVMPAIRAAFVDVGQKQDCFLHFSDLTDNLPQLLSMAGEDVPGLREPVLSLAPAKRVADDESEPDVEDTLEVESSPSADDDEKRTSRSSRSRRGRGRNRGRGRGRRGGREEEEEQEETGRRVLPSVIDLSSPPKRRAPRPEPEPEPEPEEEPTTEAPDAPADEPTPEPEAADATPADAASGSDDDADADDKPKKKKRRRRRSGRGKKKDSADQNDSDDDALAEAEGDADDEPKKKKKKGDKKDKGKKKRDRAETADADSGSDEPEASDSDAADEPESDTADVELKRRKRLPSTLDLTSSSSARPSRRSSDDSDESNDDDTSARSRRRSGRRSDSAEVKSDSHEAAEAGGSTPADETSPRGNRSPRTRSRDESRTDAPADAPDSDAESEGRSRRKSRSGRSGRDEGRDNGRSQQDDATSDADDRQPKGRDADREAKGDDRDGRDPKGGRSRDRSDGRRSDDRRGRSGDRGRSSGGSGQKIPPADQLLKRDTKVIVKITKEAISTKGPRVSTDLSLAGRFLVLVPAADYVAVSKKIESAKERRRLRTLATSLKPDGFGVIVRTVAEGRDPKSLDTDLKLLVDRWRKIEQKLNENPDPPVLLYEDVNMVSSIVRDLFSEDFDRILVDDPKVFRQLQAYVKAVAPDMADKVEMHKGRTSAFRSVGIEDQVEEAFSKRVNMKGGGYLFIETTEAMHVVDVNSGRAGRGKSQKQNLIDVNVQAAYEVAKQLRLRDLGGIIVVDFIDLKYDRDRRKVTDALKEAFKRDRAVTKLIPMSDFGLVQITRQRLRPSITAQTTDEDGEPLEGAEAAAAAGASEILKPGQRPYEPEAETDDQDDRDDRPSRGRSERPTLAPEDSTPQALAGRVRGWLDHYRQTVDDQYKGRPIVVKVHPLLGSFLRRGFPSPLTRWRLGLRGIAFTVEQDATVDPLAFDVRDQKSGRSLLRKYSA